MTSEMVVTKDHKDASDTRMQRGEASCLPGESVTTTSLHAHIAKQTPIFTHTDPARDLPHPPLTSCSSTSHPCSCCSCSAVRQSTNWQSGDKERTLFIERHKSRRRAKRGTSSLITILVTAAYCYCTTLLVPTVAHQQPSLLSKQPAFKTLPTQQRYLRRSDIAPNPEASIRGNARQLSGILDELIQIDDQSEYPSLSSSKPLQRKAPSEENANGHKSTDNEDVVGRESGSTIVRTNEASNDPPTTANNDNGDEIIKEAIRVNFRVPQVSKPKSADSSQFVAQVEETLQDYLLTNLRQRLQNDFVELRAVSLVVSALQQRRLHVQHGRLDMALSGGQRLLQDDATTNNGSQEIVTLEVGGSIQFDIEPNSGVDLDTFRQSVDQEVDTLVTETAIKTVLTDANLIGGDANTPTTSPPERDTNQEEQNGNKRNNGERPSTLSIVFGFVLTAIATAGLFVYAYIFYRKRKKRLAKQRQRKESVTYGGGGAAASGPKIGRMPVPGAAKRKPGLVNPSRISPRRSVAPKPQTAIQIPDAADDEDTSASSYHGMHGSDEAKEDNFGKALQIAASLDQQAWEHVQRKKSSFEQIGTSPSSTTSPIGVVGISATSASSVARYDAGSQQYPTTMNGVPQGRQQQPQQLPTEDGGTRSFPYGDESEASANGEMKQNPFSSPGIDDDEPSEQGIEWTEADLAGTTNEEYMGQFPADPLESISQSFGEDDIVEEVERLSTYVKRYEIRKERRVQREQQVRPRTFARIGFDGQIIDNSSDHMDEKKEVDDPPRHNGTTHSQGNEPPNDMVQAPTQQSRGVSFGGPNPHVNDESNVAAIAPRGPHQQSPNSRISLEQFEIDDDETTLEDPNMRLGITPFSVQKPGTLLYDDIASPISPMMKKLARDSARKTPKSVDDTTNLTDEQTKQSLISRESKHSQATARTQNTKPQLHTPENVNRMSLAKLRGVGGVGVGTPRTGNKLQALRANTSVVDTTRSEIYVSTKSPAQDDYAENAKSRFRASSTRRRSNSFHDLRSKFEGSQGAIFPPDASWQYGSSTPSSAGAGNPN